MRKIKFSMACFIAVLFVTVSFAQNVTVKGKVTDNATGEPVPFASIQVKGTMTGAATDAAGIYSIDVSKNATLVFSSIGYSNQEVDVNGRGIIDILLVPDAESLDETIVVAYGTARKSSFTGSASKVNGEVIASASSESIDKALAGKVAGVRMSTDNGDPGSAASIQIRGVGSISASTQPLYVIDGVIIDPSTEGDLFVGYKSTAVLNTINPDDIESLSVLKDAAAASLYGSRAANGVIVITTKKGRAGKTTITYNGEVGMTQIANMKAFEIMDGPTFMQWVADSYDGYFQMNGFPSYAAYVGYPGTSVDCMKEEGWFYDPTGNTSTKWQNEVFQNAFTMNHQLGIGGGNDNTRFYGSLGYTKNHGVVLGSDFERFSGRINIDHKVGKWLDISVRQMISYSKTNGYADQSDQEQGWGNASPTSSIFQQDPTAPVKDENGEWLNGTSWSGTVDNPHLAFEDNSYEYYKTNTARSLTNIDLQFNFTSWLKLKNTFGYDWADSRQYMWWGPTSVDGSSLNGLKEEYDLQSKTLTNSTILHFDNQIGLHSISAMAGFEYSHHYGDYINASANNYPTPKLPALSVGALYGVGGSSSVSTMLSILASANYNFDNKYYIAATIRRDGSSRLGPDSRWANFWSVSGAWRLSREDFIDSGLLNDFKLKASYGTNGNLPGSYYAFKGLYSMGSAYGGQSAIYWASPDNNSLGWEKSNNFNVGFEWNMYDRVQLDVEYFNKYTSSLLFSRPASIVTGFSSYTANIGNLRNRGVEVELTSYNFKRKNFTWTTNLNFTFLKNRIMSLPDGEDILSGDGNLYLMREGESMYTFYLPTYLGVNRETGLGEFLINPDKPATPDNITNEYSKAGSTIQGKAIPDITGGLTNTFRIKNLDVSFLISYQFGGSLFDYMEYFTVSDGMRMGSFNQLAKAADYWTESNRDATYPRVIYSNPYRSDRWSSRHIKSTDNIRMREVTIGYTIPFKKAIESLRLYVKATNPVMIWSATPDVDPDVPINGYRTVDVPATRSFVFGVNLTL